MSSRSQHVWGYVSIALSSHGLLVIVSNAAVLSAYSL